MFNKELQVFIFMIFVCDLSYVHAQRGIIQETETTLRYKATCQHADLIIECKQDHVISIINAAETPSPATKCMDTVINTTANCVTAHHFATTKCSMQQYCEQQSLKDVIIGSKCPTSSTYYVVVFQCIKYPELSTTSHIVCYNKSLDINCAPGLISISDSFYGRKERTVCAGETSIKHFFDDPTAPDIMRRKCDGRTKCEIYANKTFGFVFKNGGIYPKTNYLEFTLRCFDKNLLKP